MSRERRRTRSLPHQESPAVVVSPDHEEPAPIQQADPTPTPQQRAQVQVISGAHLQSFPLAGLCVSHARALLDPLLALAPRAPTLVNGRPASDDDLLQTGDTLEFVHQAGEKGSSGWTRG